MQRGVKKHHWMLQVEGLCCFHVLQGSHSWIRLCTMCSHVSKTKGAVLYKLLFSNYFSISCDHRMLPGDERSWEQPFPESRAHPWEHPAAAGSCCSVPLCEPQSWQAWQGTVPGELPLLPAHPGQGAAPCPSCLASGTQAEPPSRIPCCQQEWTPSPKADWSHLPEIGHCLEGPISVH